MDDTEKAQVEATRKVLAFPPKGSDLGAAEVGAVTQEGVRNAERAGRRMGWLAGTWVLFAWIIAERRVSLAATHREVFGAEATTALLVFISMPMIYARRLAMAVRGVANRLLSAKAARRGAEPRADAQVTVFRRPRARKRRRGKR
jgi:hypothetical protein